MKIKLIDESLRKDAIEIIKESWGSDILVSRGKVHHMELATGLAAIEGNQIVGLITYDVHKEECEIVSLDSFDENKGIGSRLIEEVFMIARQNGCKRVWLITTNDNTRAIRFYQKRGYNMIALHVGAVDEARKIKPQIPATGYDDIPIRHEIEFERCI
ncbi:GNAT family N-acetyltransferase [Clostridium oryzae]|uniref:Putative acetyltransferase n=1 Tax=Clostridium oryzae TaxID=1450648 RepID=A0A1V4IDU7_9CLOT|nr:GNAT family N-acetyltransferase [Clostridium oryzae]OPJ58106.1 putative acetyltransferase [Clostridium oryzae]